VLAHARLSLSTAALGLITLVSIALVGPLATTADAGATAPPEVGECRDITLEQLYKNSNRTNPIDCSESHTARVIKVPTLPDSMNWETPIAKIERFVTKRCNPAWQETLGRTDKSRALTAYSWGWFVPTKEQRDAGARWIRCDLILWGGTRSLVALPTDDVPALGDLPHPDKIAKCLTRHPYSTNCARRHAWRATGVFTMDADTFPGERRIRRAAVRKCPSRVSTDVFRWTFRGKLVWKLGDHTVVCYSRTSN
jgi:hypothetical protein